MRLLIFLVLSRYGLACKYRITSQISIYKMMYNFIFLLFLVLHFHIFKIKLQLIGLTSYISTCCGKSDGLSNDELRAVSSAQIAILHRTSSRRPLK